MSNSNTETKPIRCHVEIYEPDREEDVLAAYRGSGSFMAFSVGDVIDIRNMSLDDMPPRIKVKKVEHLLWELDTHVSHKIMILTTKADD